MDSDKWNIEIMGSIMVRKFYMQTFKLFLGLSLIFHWKLWFKNCKIPIQLFCIVLKIWHQGSGLTLVILVRIESLEFHILKSPNDVPLLSDKQTIFFINLYLIICHFKIALDLPYLKTNDIFWTRTSLGPAYFHSVKLKLKILKLIGIENVHPFAWLLS